MKKIQLIIFSLWSIIGLNIASDEHNKDGEHDSGGGDAYVQDFIKNLDKSLDIYKEYIPELQRTNLRAKLDIPEITVISKRKVSHNGQEVDAINIPSQKKIILSRKRFKDIDSEAMKMRLSFHEYLGLVGIDDTQYRLSKKINIRSKYEGPENSYCNWRNLGSHKTNNLIKPSSDRDGKLIILLSCQLMKRVEEVSIFKNGKFVEIGRDVTNYIQPHNDNRVDIRFSKPGSFYGYATVRIKINGTYYVYEGDLSKRVQYFPIYSDSCR